jgi:hypothetical protein
MATCPGDNTGLLDLLLQLDARGVEPVLYKGGALGVRGLAVSRVPPPLWAEFERLRQALARHLKSEPTPYRARVARGLLGGGEP